MNTCKNCGQSIYQAEIHSKEECIDQLKSQLQDSRAYAHRLEEKVTELQEDLQSVLWEMGR